MLINCAGFAALAPTADTDEAAFDGLFQINVKAPFFLVAALAPKIAARGGGSIINVSTMVASYGQPGMAAYGASRASIELLPRRGPPNTGPRTSASTRSHRGRLAPQRWSRGWRWPRSLPRRFRSAGSLTSTSCLT